MTVPAGKTQQPHHDVTILLIREEFSSLFENLLDDAGLTLTLVNSLTTPKLVIDLRHVRFIGSAFLGRCIVLQKALTSRAGGQLALCNMNSFTRTALSLAALDKVIPVFDSAELAIQALQ
jgi:anti-anti-sigma factor